VTATLEGIVAQRLVRKSASNCKTEYTPTEEQLMELELRPEDVAGKKFLLRQRVRDVQQHRLQGPPGLYEIMTLDDDMRDMIIKHASTQVLRARSQKARHAHAAAKRVAGHL
jgi:type IV pilus assembly protein PilB